MEFKPLQHFATLNTSEAKEYLLNILRQLVFNSNPLKNSGNVEHTNEFLLLVAEKADHWRKRINDQQVVSRDLFENLQALKGTNPCSTVFLKILIFLFVVAHSSHISPKLFPPSLCY
jgi:hypothetical protein